MSALAQPPIDAAQIYNDVVRAIFSRWTLLRLAVDQGWADGDEAQKANELVERVLELVAIAEPAQRSTSNRVNAAAVVGP